MPLRGPGLRRSCVLSVSSEADSEDGEWSAWVAGMVTERGGEVGRPSAAERADGEVAQAGHDLWAGPAPDLGGVLGEGHIPYVVQAVLDRCRPFSIAQCPRMRSASRAGLAWAWVRLVAAKTTSVRLPAPLLAHERRRDMAPVAAVTTTCRNTLCCSGARCGAACGMAGGGEVPRSPRGGPTAAPPPDGSSIGSA